MGSLLLEEEGTAPSFQLLICCVTSGKSLPLSGPWTPVSEMRRAKISKLSGNSDTLGSCWGLRGLRKRIGIGAGFQGLALEWKVEGVEGGKWEKRSPKVSRWL